MDDTNTYNLSTHTISQHTISQHTISQHTISQHTISQHIQYLNTYNISTHTISQHIQSLKPQSLKHTQSYTHPPSIFTYSQFLRRGEAPPLVYRTQFPAVGGRNPHIQSLNIDTSAVDSYLRARASILTSGRSPALVYRAALAPVGGAPPRCGALPPPPRKQPSKISRPFDITHKE